MLRVVEGGGGPAQERSSASLRSVAVVWAGFGRLRWPGVFEEAGYGLVEGSLGGCGCG